MPKSILSPLSHEATPSTRPPISIRPRSQLRPAARRPLFFPLSPNAISYPHAHTVTRIFQNRRGLGFLRRPKYEPPSRATERWSLPSAEHCRLESTTQDSVAAAAAATKSHRRASLPPPLPSTAVGRASWAVSRWVAAVSWPPPSPGYCFPVRSELSGFGATGAGSSSDI